MSKTKLTTEEQEVANRFANGTATVDDFELLGDYNKNIYQILRKKIAIVENHTNGYLVTFISRPPRNKYHIVEVLWCKTQKQVKSLQDNYSKEHNFSCTCDALDKKSKHPWSLSEDIEEELDMIVHELNEFDVQEHFGYEYYWENRGNIDWLIDKMQEETGRIN